MRIPTILLILIVACTGCSSASLDEEFSGELRMDVTPLTLRSVDGVQQACRTVADEALLRVNGRRAGAHPLADVTGAVVFEDVRAPRGAARFDVDVQSTNGAILYAGRTDVDIENEPFQVGVELDHRNGVLRVCPGEISIANGRGNLFLENIGDRDIDVTIDPPNSTCDGPCVHFPFTSFRLPAGEGGTMTISRGPGATGRYDVRIESNVGHLTLTVHAD